MKVLLASTAVLLGDHRECLRLIDELEAKRSWRYAARTVVMRVQQASLRSSALVSLGRAAKARAQRERLRELLAAERARHPGRRAEAFEYFGNHTLHQWAREALGRTGFGQILVSLAWAFDRRGDEAMARHLLAEAPARATLVALHEEPAAVCVGRAEAARLGAAPAGAAVAVTVATRTLAPPYEFGHPRRHRGRGSEPPWDEGAPANRMRPSA